VGTYLYSCWFGQAKCSYSVASWSGLLNRAELLWDTEWLNVLEIDRSALPPLAADDDYQRVLTPEYANRWPALHNVPFYPAIGDGAAANIGSGCADESHVALTVGTTAALRVVTSANLPPVPDGLWGYRVTSKLHLIGGATSEGGNIFSWATETLALNSISDLEMELAKRAPDGHSLTVLPLLAGERSPGWATNATGAIVGLRLSTTPLDILQASLEAVALRLAPIIERLTELTVPPVTLIAGGGALTASPAWVQMMVNALNRPLYLTTEPEITARGVALLALYGIGARHLNDLRPEVMRVVEPNPQHVAIFRAALQRQSELYQKLILNDG
jgi:gluconokinase